MSKIFDAVETEIQGMVNASSAGLQSQIDHLTKQINALMNRDAVQVTEDRITEVVLEQLRDNNSMLAIEVASTIENYVEENSTVIWEAVKRESDFTYDLGSIVEDMNFTVSVSK